METIEINGTEDIWLRIRSLEKSGVADFNVEYVGETDSIIERAWCDNVKIEFINACVDDELNDEYWDVVDRRAVRNMYNG